MRSDRIEVEEASTHNLKGVSCSFPHRAMTVVTGVSGSGKSSLAFDTVYAEGQRRYVETLSTYARQFLEQMARPPVKAVRHVPPALALKQGNSVTNARSTVASVTEIDDFLRLLFAGAGVTWCKSCGARVEPHTVRTVSDRLLAEHAGERVVVLGTVRPEAHEAMAEVLRQLAADGFRRVEHDGELHDIDSPGVVDLLAEDSIRVVIDRLSVQPDSTRLAEALETAFKLGDCVADVVLWEHEKRELRFYDHLRCTSCDTPHVEQVPAVFDRTSAVGACSTCGGYGRTVGIDRAKVVPDPRATIDAGAIAPFQTPSMRRHQRRLVGACAAEGIPVDVPWADLPEKVRRRILGTGFGDFIGVRGFFSDLEEDRYKPHIRILIARYRGYADCDVCDGTGLSDDARAVKVAGINLGDLERLEIHEALTWTDELELGDALERALGPLLRELRSRLGFLVESGVGYITLDRAARTLSGGEMHRVLLATSVGRSLTDTCYVLDEPTAGLHAEDTVRLMTVVTRLRDIGNTVVVVEHDPDVIALADHVVELGPAGGEDGGRVLYEGELSGLRGTDTPTGRALVGTPETAAIAEPASEFLTIEGACLNNLRGVRASFPIGRLSVVTGVSGSGKSTLVGDALYGRLMETRGQRQGVELGPIDLHGDTFDEVVLVDQAAVARSSRSCALTFSGAYTAIRGLFAGTSLARMQGFAAGAFSFNAAGGRCDRCEGTGVRTIEMHFMADVALPCDVCEGRRFKDEVLAVRYRDMSIADVFHLTVDGALEAFDGHRAIARALTPLSQVGLGYLQLGQSTSQLSGGELQRLKLASYVGKSARDSSRLFIFDEPTVGLHVDDVRVLLRALRLLVDTGNTVIVVEHNLDFVAGSDWVVDLGPGAGPQGGRVVYEGRVGGLPGCPESVTGRHLARALGRASSGV